MPPDAAQRHVRTGDHLCSPSSLNPGLWEAGKGRGEAEARHGHNRRQAGKSSQTDNFFLRSPSEGGPSRGQGHNLSKDRPEQKSVFIRAPSDGARQPRHRPSLSSRTGVKAAKESDSGVGFAGRLSFDFAAAVAQRPAVAFSGPLPRLVPEQWGDESPGFGPRGNSQHSRTEMSSSWVEHKGKSESWQHRTKRWLLLKPSVRARGRRPSGPLMSLVPMSDGALGMTLREEPEEEASVLTPTSRKALFCPSRQSFIDSVSSFNW